MKQKLLTVRMNDGVILRGMFGPSGNCQYECSCSRWAQLRREAPAEQVES